MGEMERDRQGRQIRRARRSGWTSLVAAAGRDLAKRKRLRAKLAEASRREMASYGARKERWAASAELERFAVKAGHQVGCCLRPRRPQLRQERQAGEGPVAERWKPRVVLAARGWQRQLARIRSAMRRLNQCSPDAPRLRRWLAGTSTRLSAAGAAARAEPDIVDGERGV